MSRPALLLLIAVSLLFSVGLLMVFDTTAAEVLHRGLDKSTHHALIRQMLYAAAGVAGAAGCWVAGYHTLLKLSGLLMAVGVLLLTLVFLPGVGMQINGAHRWLSLCGNSIQPSEFMKVILPLYAVHALSKEGKPLTLRAFARLFLHMAAPLGLILIEPDNGTFVILFLAAAVLFFLARVPARYWAWPLVAVFFIGGCVAAQMPHVRDRLAAYMHPEEDLRGKGHQPFQAKIAAGSGGLFGRGLAESLQKLDYLPEARSDYIAAIFAEEFGFAGILGLIVLYMLLAYCGVRIAVEAIDMQGFYVASMLTFLLCVQAFLNLGVVSGLLPSKGTNLPFFSQGGSSLFANCLMLALILNVSRRPVLVPLRK
jgi:cell division protein FtsW